MAGTSRRAAGALVVAAAFVGPLAVASPAQAAGGPTIIAHRGDMSAAPENTNAAFRRAISKGANAIEMDIRFSETGWPVIMHDETLDRTTNCTGTVQSKTLKQLAKCDAGKSFGAGFRGERIPTLGSALRTIASRSGSVKAVLHIKRDPTGDRAKRIRDAVRRAGMFNRVVVIADTNGHLSRMRSVGFKELGRVFSSASDWDLKYEYMVPYELKLNHAAIAAIHRRGGKVWPVEQHPHSLTGLLDVISLDGIIVNNLTAALRLS